MENILKLGGKEFKVQVNFKKTYDLTKYRNKVSMGFDFSKADKSVVEEILKASQSGAAGDLDISTLSPEALVFLRQTSQNTLFTYEEVVDITKILTGIEEDNEADELLNKEMEVSDFDSVIAKLVEAINLVFTNVKGSSK